MPRDNDQRVLAVVERAVSEVNQQRFEGKTIHWSPDTTLVGGQGNLDSLGFISLMVAVEEEIEKEFRVRIALTEDLPRLAGHDSPVQNIGALVGYITRQLET